MHTLARRSATLAWALFSLAAATPAAAQQEWRNPYTGRIWNNPNASTLDTWLHNDQQRRMMQHYYGRDPGRQPHPMESPRQATPRTQAWQPQQPQPQSGGVATFRLINASGMTINEVYVSSSQVSQWGPDRLGQAVLPAGRGFVVEMPPGMCVNDIRVVYANGQSLERRGVNTCAIIDLRLP